MDFIGAADFASVAATISTAIIGVVVAMVAISALTIPLGAGKKVIGYLSRKISFR